MFRYLEHDQLINNINPELIKKKAEGYNVDTETYKNWLQLNFMMLH
ncbi:hypothetical protein AAEX28_01045 [Lentisphaerota bacterium WC36G]|nr:hypothetical protein LJT99_03925 [Lentisphaerae bacterium WC36]